MWDILSIQEGYIMSPYQEFIKYLEDTPEDKANGFDYLYPQRLTKSDLFIYTLIKQLDSRKEGAYAK